MIGRIFLNAILVPLPLFTRFYNYIPLALTQSYSIPRSGMLVIFFFKFVLVYMSFSAFY